MSQRFSPITSDLLARKGEASPSAIKPSLFWRRPPLAEVRPQPSRDLRAQEAMRDLRATETKRDLREATRDLRLTPVEPPRDLRAQETADDLRMRDPMRVPLEPVLELHTHEIDPVPAGVVPPMGPEGPRPHKMMVTLSHADYEKLGIAAVKKGVTRQQMLRVAVDLHIERLKREYGGCGCMAMGGTGTCGEGCGAH